jgi:beta-galactosidase
LKTTGDPFSFKTSFDKEYLKKGGDLAHLKIEIVDSEGNRVTTTTETITVEVEGKGNLLGIDSGEIVDGDVDLRSNSRKAYYGKLLAFIKSGNDKGSINISISAPDLESKSVRIQVK